MIKRLIVVGVLLFVLGCESGPRYPDLLSAAEAGDAKDVKYYLSQGADINEKDEYGATPLICAVSSKDTETVKILVQAGANVNIADLKGRSALFWAALSGLPEIAECLIEAKANINVRTGGMRLTPLHIAAEEGNLEVVRLLLSNGADVNAKDDWGQTPLRKAKSNNNMELVELLQTHGGTK